MTDNELTSDVRQQILEALIAGRKIEAIKLYREATGRGLKEAKDFIDQLVEELSDRHPELLGTHQSGCSPMAVVAVVISIVSAVSLGALSYWLTH